VFGKAGKRYDKLEVKTKAGHSLVAGKNGGVNKDFKFDAKDPMIIGFSGDSFKMNNEGNGEDYLSCFAVHYIDRADLTLPLA